MASMLRPFILYRPFGRRTFQAASAMDTTLLWIPKKTPDSSTPYARFRDRIATKYQVKLSNYWDFHKWSTDNYPQFWEEVVNFCDVIRSSEWTEVVDKNKRIDEIPKWFTGMKLNYAENLLKRNDDQVAIYYTGEYTKEIRRMTFNELRQSVQAYAAGLKKLGIQCGDRVAGYLPNSPEAVIAMLAATSMGAVWSSASPDFGVVGVVERFEQVKPKVLFGVEGVVYNQKYHDNAGKLSEIVAALPSVQKVIIVPFVDPPEGQKKNSSYQFIPLKDFLDQGRLSDGTYPRLEFQQVPFHHPLFIMFSSGTTGAPKCMVHSVGGTLVKHVQEHHIQLNLTPSDTMLFYTTVGWMMWNWLVSALATGTSIVLYDGSPFLPRTDTLFDVVDNAGITTMGLGAKLYATYESKNLVPMNTHKLSTLRCLLSTGSPLMPQTFEYIYNNIKKDVLLGSMTGGTDLIATFAGATWDLPVHRGEIQAPDLGCAIKCFSDEGKPVFGERGEFICAKPFPSMPTQFLNDPDGEKYKKAYFKRFPGIWAHGDFCMINPSTGGIVVLGRSDGTLNPGGVRFGSAEIYHVVEHFDEITDSLCVGQKLPGGDERVVLFLKMAAGHGCDEKLVERIRQTIKERLSARHVPYAILPIADIPYTTNGKKVEIAVKQIISGEKVQNRSALSNPQALDLYVDIPELKITKVKSQL